MSKERINEIAQFLVDNDFTPEELLIIIANIVATVYQHNAESLLIGMRDKIRQGDDFAGPSTGMLQ